MKKYRMISNITTWACFFIVGKLLSYMQLGFFAEDIYMMLMEIVEL